MEQIKEEYHIQLLDNGVVIADTENDIYECEKYSSDGRGNDVAMQNFFGKLLWGDISVAIEKLLASNAKITITVEKEK